MGEPFATGQGGGDPFKPRFPSLPIVQIGPQDSPSKPLSQAEKFGGLYYLGIGGLAVMVALLGWFCLRVWETWPVWTAIYALNDPSRPEPERVAAASRLAADPTVNDRQKWDLALNREVPARGRYILAEALSADAVAGDPRAYALSVALSEGWPDWLRLLLLRPLALAAVRKPKVPPEPLRALAASQDPVIGLWADYARAAGLDPMPEATARLRRDAESETPPSGLARLLLGALDADDPSVRRARLAEATAWNRLHHAGSAEVWAEPGPKPARELQPGRAETAEGQPRG